MNSQNFAPAQRLFALALTALLAACGAPVQEEDAAPMSMSFSNREALNLASYQDLAQYARKNGFLEGNSCVNGLKDGSKVAFSASYGIGGEAGQSRGSLVERDDGLFYQQDTFTTTQLMLPPGLPLNGPTKVSLWEFHSFTDLVCQVVFAADAQGKYTSRNQRYSSLQAAKVDFQGGTAGRNFTVQGALEIKLTQTTQAGGKSEFAAYFAPGKGLRAFEFSEGGAPQGTFKVYFGD